MEERHWIDPEMVTECDRLGRIRTVESEKRGNKDNHGLKVPQTPEGKLKDRIRQCVGVMAEYVAAMVLTGKYDFTVNTYTAPDFMLADGRPVEVKGSQNYNSLVVRPNAHCNDIYVQVFIELGEPAAEKGAWATLTGWTTPYEARLLADISPAIDHDWWQDRQNRGKPAIFMPLSYLRSIDTLHEGRADGAMRCPGCTRRVGGCRV